MKKNLILIASLILIYSVNLYSEVKEYNLEIDYKIVAYTGKAVEAMAINDSIPGPVLKFTEGDTAKINVKNSMFVETSIHWHGILLPNREDGVPYLTTPPIKPGETYTFNFDIIQAGTYWYHSHTKLQEERGLYGAIVIEPKKGKIKADKEFVAVLSDWTNENPKQIMRTLKSGNHYYALKKGAMQSVMGAIKNDALKDHINRAKIRMPQMDISDVAYDAFLINGKEESELKAEPGETVKLRLVNTAASTYFYVEFADSPMIIVAADGLNVEPIFKQRILIAMGETYDAIVVVPAQGSHEFRATAQDGSGHSSLFIGEGEKFYAPDVPKPNLYKMHSQLHANMNHGSHDMSDHQEMDHSAEVMHSNSNVKLGSDKMSDDHIDHHGSQDFDHYNYDMEDNHKTNHDMADMDHSDHEIDEVDSMDHSSHNMSNDHKMDHDMSEMNHDGMVMDEVESSDHHSHHNMKEKHSGRDLSKHSDKKNYSHDKHAIHKSSHSKKKELGLKYEVASMLEKATSETNPERPGAPYSELRSTEVTSFSDDKEIRQYTFRLNGDMNRYVWTLNNKTLRESDYVWIRKGDTVRFVLINESMMHHPMHLHGHFFRVLNKHGDFSPLKHTVDVPPMGQRIIEFDATEEKDWMFHCHVLYHMKGGMSRIVRYHNSRMDDDIAKMRPMVFMDHKYFWAEGSLLSNMTEGEVNFANTRNTLKANWEAGWDGSVDDVKIDGSAEDIEYEIELTYERYYNRFFSLFAGAEITNEEHDDRGIIGFKYLLPYLIESKVWIDTDGEFRFSLEHEVHMTDRFAVFGEVEYDTLTDWEGAAGGKYILNRYFSIVGQWHSEYDAGGGINIEY